MKNLKRFAALGLASAMVLSMAACGSTDAGKSSEASKSAETSKSAEATKSTTESSGEASSEVPAEPVELTCWVVQAQDLNWDTCSTTLVLEEMFNVDLKFQEIAASESRATQYNLMLASGEGVPDVMLDMAFSPSQVIAGAEAGLLVPLTEYIVEGTNYYERLQENPSWKDILSANDDNIYTFVYTDVGVHMNSQSKMWYRADWLEELGWDNPPSTPEEFKQYLIDIRDNDVNGNGDPNDEIPLMGFYGGTMTDPICFLMNPFELYTAEFYYITDDGEIHFSATTDGWREGLAYIADLYAEGLIAEETYVQDQATWKALLNKTPEEAVIGTTPNWRVAGYVDKSIEGMGNFTYEALAPLAGDYQQTYCRDGASNIQMRGAITSACEHPEVAFKVLDYLLSEEGSMLVAYGPEGQGYEWVNEKSYIGTTPAIKKLTTDNVSLRQHVWYAGAPKIDSKEIRYGLLLDESNKENDTTWELMSAAEIYAPYHVDCNIPAIVWADDDVITQRNEMASLISGYIKTADTEFIMGIRDINDDAQWEAYLKDLEDMGLEDYIELLYTYYGLK